MPTTNTKIFSNNTNPATINKSDIFYKPSFLYLVAPDITEELEIDISLNIYLTPSTVRLVRLGTKIFDTEAILDIPDKFKGSDLPFQLALLASTDDFLEVYNVTVDCCLKKEFDDLKQSVDRALLERTITNIVTNPVGGTISAVASLILPELPNRAGFTLYNPTDEPILVNFGSPDDTGSGNYVFPLNPGMFYVDDTGWDGAVSALTSNGQTADIIIKEFVGALPTSP